MLAPKKKTGAFLRRIKTLNNRTGGSFRTYKAAASAAKETRMSQENPKNEVLKSALIGVAALVALVCWMKFQPRLPDAKPKEKIGRRLLENFDETTKISRVEFVGVDSETGEAKELTLVREGD